MMSEVSRKPIRGVGVVQKRSPNGLWQVKMANGYQAEAHLDRKLNPRDILIETGDKLKIEFSAYSMKQARILAKVN